jgi:thiol-disulfide isomerase/thioredoxin
MRFVRLDFVLAAAVGAVLVSLVGCSPVAAPPAGAGALFALPAAGTATDTVLRIGDAFPPIRAVDLDGNAVTFDKTIYGDRCTLIVFWSTWCGFCMQELPHEVELARKYERAGLRVIGVNADQTPEIAKRAVQQYGVPWLNVFEGRELTVSRQLGIRRWPTLILLGPDGKVVMGTDLLRSGAVQALPDGSTRTVKGLDWVLEKLLNKGETSRTQ